MSGKRIVIRIYFEDCEVKGDTIGDATKEAEGSFSIQLPEALTFDIDACEEALLKANYPALRDALKTHLESMSKKKAEEMAPEVLAACYDRGEIRQRKVAYCVDSEIGRFTFATHEVCLKDWIGYRTTELLPSQRGNKYYLTRGFRELAFLHGSVDGSYRKTINRLNRQRHKTQDGTPLNTLRDQTEAEGKAVIDFWNYKCKQVFEEHGLNIERPPNEQEAAELIVDKKRVLKKSCAATKDVNQAKHDANIPEELREDIELNPVGYECQTHAVCISVDGVLAKKQREKRERTSSEGETAGTSKRGPHRLSKKEKTKKRVDNKTATISSGKQYYTFVAESYVAIFAYLIAFILHNTLQNHRMCFFVDGERALSNTIKAWFAWHPSVVVILDWYHLQNKCGERLSMALKGRKLRNEHLEALKRLLWYGATAKAIAYLKQLPSSAIKSQLHLDKLCAYLEKRSDMIPCYAVRKEIGLRNSSTDVEKANDLLVSARQKHQGMSWSQTGSLALAALTAVVKNGHQKSWLQNKELPFEFPLAANDNCNIDRNSMRCVA